MDGLRSSVRIALEGSLFGTATEREAPRLLRSSSGPQLLRHVQMPGDISERTPLPPSSDEEVTKNAIHSLYGEGHVNATRTRECVAMPGVRNQVVLTGEPIVRGLHRLWDGEIAYDAAHAKGGWVETDKRKKKFEWFDSIVNAMVSTSTRGLLDPWPHKTYCNPPYGASLFDPENEMEAYELELEIRDAAKKNGTKAVFPEGLPIKKASLCHWLMHQLEHSEGESVMLVPNRTQRDWFRTWRDEVDGLFELNPQKFLGYKQAFPAPLVLGYVGDRIDRFWWAFEGLGDPVYPR